jgi:hypothetical protein
MSYVGVSGDLIIREMKQAPTDHSYSREKVQFSAFQLFREN